MMREMSDEAEGTYFTHVWILPVLIAVVTYDIFNQAVQYSVQ